MSERIVIKINPRVCSGCLSCMTTCSIVNESYSSLTAARVQIELDPFGETNKILICRQCTKAICIDVCSENAITRDPNGCLVINNNLCTGCLACVNACPFDALFWNPISEQVVSCSLCHGDPRCVQVCPTNALMIQIMPGKTSVNRQIDHASKDIGEGR